MMNKKTIQINPELFKVSKQTRKKTANPSSSPKLQIKNSRMPTDKNKTTKNQILKYIRQQQQQKYDEMLKQNTNTTISPTTTNLIDNFETDFKQSLDFLNNVTEKNKTTVPKTWNSTLKNTGSLLMQPAVFNHVLHNPSPPPTEYTDENVNTIVPDVFSQPQRVLLPPPPQYGCLKGGSLPTYRSWNTAKNMSSLTGRQSTNNSVNANTNTNTHENNSVFANTNVNAHENTNTNNSVNTTPSPEVSQKPSIEERLANPAWLKPQPRKHTSLGINTKHAIEQKMKELQSQTPYNPKRRQRKTMRRTFVLGKSKNYPKISVLVSNKTLRKQIGTRQMQLKQTPIDEIRRTLIKKGLIKVGSIAPNDVLRQMYETMNMMCGDLHNHNPDNLIYNYLNGAT